VLICTYMWPACPNLDKSIYGYNLSLIPILFQNFHLISQLMSLANQTPHRFVYKILAPDAQLINMRTLLRDSAGRTCTSDAAREMGFPANCPCMP
jgi:hypothetical protein